MRRHVYYYTLLSGFDRAAERLTTAPGAWLPRPAEQSGDRWRVAMTAQGVLPAALADHLAEVEVGTPLRADTVVVPIRWRSASADRLLPVLEADLELAPLEEDAAHLSLLGSYRPPLSVVGDVGDRLLGHRVAEACVRRFVLDVAAGLEQAPLRS